MVYHITRYAANASRGWLHPSPGNIIEEVGYGIFNPLSYLGGYSTSVLADHTAYFCFCSRLKRSANAIISHSERVHKPGGIDAAHGAGAAVGIHIDAAAVAEWITVEEAA